MLTFLRLGNKGNFANQLFQIASTIGIAKENGHDYCFPKWKYDEYFENELPKTPNHEINWKQIAEKQFNYYEWNVGAGNYSIEGWLQTEKYFENADIKSVFKFRKNFKENLLKKYAYLFTKKTIIIPIRRGDFVDNKYYFQVTYKYYFTALLKYFPDLENYNIIFTSNDINYCKFHFAFLKNAYFLEGTSAIEEFCIATNCDHFIISNSTFSWWIAWLGEKAGSKVIRPIRNFDGAFTKKYDESDFFCKRWTVHDDSKERIPIKYLLLILKGDLYYIRQRVRNKLKKYYYIIKGKATDLK